MTIQENNTSISVEPCAICGGETGRRYGMGRIPREILTDDGGAVCRTCAAACAPDQLAWLDRYYAGGPFSVPDQYAEKINTIADQIHDAFIRRESHLGDRLHYEAVGLFAEAFGLTVTRRGATLHEIQNQMRHSARRDAYWFQDYWFDHRRFLRYGKGWPLSSRYAGLVSFTYGGYDEDQIRTLAADRGLVVAWPSNVRDFYNPGSTDTYLWMAPDGDLAQHIISQEAI